MAIGEFRLSTGVSRVTCSLSIQTVTHGGVLWFAFARGGYPTGVLLERIFGGSI